MSVVRVAAIQAAPVYLDRNATIDRVAELTAQAASDNAELVLFPAPMSPLTIHCTTPVSRHMHGPFA